MLSSRWEILPALPCRNSYHTIMDEQTLRACQDLKVIVFMGTGASSYIDVEAAERIGIRVRTIRDYGNRTVAEHAVALMFAAGRRIAARLEGVSW